jgi:hypothetical protein
MKAGSSCHSASCVLRPCSMRAPLAARCCCAHTQVTATPNVITASLAPPVSPVDSIISRTLLCLEPLHICVNLQPPPPKLVSAAACNHCHNVSNASSHVPRGLNCAHCTGAYFIDCHSCQCRCRRRRHHSGLAQRRCPLELPSARRHSCLVQLRQAQGHLQQAVYL